MSREVPDWEDQIRLHKPTRAIVFGSGMQAFPDDWVGVASIGQEVFSGLKKSQIQGHKGTISLGHCAGNTILILHGRVHSYEGYSKSQVCSMVRVLGSWGVTKGLLLNATGGVDPLLEPGELLSVSHVWDATGPNWNVCQGKVPWMKIDANRNLTGVKMGRYAMVSGPSYETAAEVTGLGRLGVHLVGMSSAWEIQEGNRLGISLELLSVVANMGTGLTLNPLTHHEVCQVMSQSESKILKASREWLTGNGQMIRQGPI